MNQYKMVAFLFFTQTQAVEASPIPLWEKIIQYGALGAIVVYLLWERHSDRKEDRITRKQQAVAINKNTMATFRLSQKMQQLTNIIWLHLGGKGPPPPPPQEDDTPKELQEIDPDTDVTRG